MTRDELLLLLQNKFPNHFFKEGEEFSNDKKGSIWSCGEDTNQLYYGQPLFDYYNLSNNFNGGINIKLVKFLETKGWYCEWYDCGTVFIYEI